MAGLLDIFGTGGLTELGLLGVSPEEINRYRDDAQAQALYKLAENMFAGGPTGASIAKGLAQGQQAYKEAMRGEMTDMLMQQKLVEAQKAKQNEQAINKLIMGGYQPAKAAVSPDTPLFNNMGQEVAGPNMPQAASPEGFDLKSLTPKLLAIPGGIDKLASLAKVIPELRKAGAMGQQGGNPFEIMMNDPNIPPVYRNLAGRYAQSYAAGLIDDATVDQRLKELSQASQNAIQFQQTQAGLQQQRAATTAIQQGMLDLRKQAEANKPEQLSFIQKKDFEVVQGLKDSATKAESNAQIARLAAPLLDQAYGSKAEAGIKGVAGALGLSTAAKDANDTLTSYSTQLAVNAPRFSGPTSDYDAKSYREAVGDLANPSKSLESKKQALSNIIKLSNKAKQQASQAENYFYSNDKSLRGFKFNENPYDGM